MPPAGRLRLLAAGLAGAAGQGPGPAAVLVQDGRILAVGQDALAHPAPEKDLRPAWLSPAPLDAHVHLCLRGQARDNLAACRAAGIAAVRDLGNPPRNQRPRGLPDVPPLVRASGPGLCAAGEARTWLGQECQGPEAFARAARERIAGGAAVVKLFATGLLDFGRPGQVEHPLALDQAEMAAAVQAAAQDGIPVAAHTSGVDSVRACLRAGVASLEHGFFLDRATLELMAAQKVAWVPTLAAVEAHAVDPEGRHHPATRRNLARIADGQARAMLLAEELGVDLVMGTDAGSYGLPHGQALFMEMDAWLRAGLGPATVFAAATSRAARLLGLAGEVGVIAPGARAWLLATKSDPRQEPLTLRDPLWRTF